MRDADGQTIQVGSRVAVHIESAFVGNKLAICLVVGFTPKKVRIRVDCVDGTSQVLSKFPQYLALVQTQTC